CAPAAVAPAGRVATPPRFLGHRGNPGPVPTPVHAAAASRVYESAAGGHRSSRCVRITPGPVAGLLPAPIGGRGRTTSDRGGCAARDWRTPAGRATRVPPGRVAPLPVGCGTGAGDDTTRYPGGRKNPGTPGSAPLARSGRYP